MIDQFSTLRTRSLRCLLGFVVAMAVVVWGPSNALAAEHVEKPNLVGLASEDFRTDIPRLVAADGRPPALFSLFWTLGPDWPNAWAAGMLEDLDQLGVAAYIELTTDDLGTFESIANGRGDQLIDALISSIGPWLDSSPDHRLLLAPFPEANLEQHPWGARPNEYKTAFRRIRDAFRSAGLGPEDVRFVFAMNGLSSSGLDYQQFYPGDGYADIIGFSKLNRGEPWRDYEATFGTHLREMQQKVSRTKPILITQTGSVTSGGDRDAWLAEMFTRLKAHDQVIGAIYFNRLKNHDFRVISASDVDPVFLNYSLNWSPPNLVSWIFDGSLDAWVTQRAQALAAGFVDVEGSVFAAEIAWMASSGITRGCNPPTNDRFCPDAFVTRGQMAAFLTRGLNLGDRRVRDAFSDDDGSVFESDIDRLASSGIARGCDPPTNQRFCPEHFVTRAQMAAFLVRALKYPDASPDAFIDDDKSVFEADIEKLAAVGVTRGCNPPTNNRFCPDEFVTRGQMAAFLMRALAR